MAKKSAIARNNKRMRMVSKYMDLRTELKSIANDSKVSFEDGVKLMLADINHWQDAPLWDKESIFKATKTWFKYMSD